MRRIDILPPERSSFVGRQRLVDELHTELTSADTRLLTLTGTGGTGKTRLALVMARRVREQFADGVAFVDLAPLTAAEQVIPRIAETLAVHTPAGASVTGCLHDFLRLRQTLLLLDNFEHVLGAVPDVAELLADSPGLTVLATSRTALNLSGEHERLVPPLSLPEQTNDPDLDHVMEAEAVALFVERVRAHQSSFAVTPETASAIGRICRRLDGLPLAIELAAAWIKRMSPSALARCLEHRLDLLTNGRADNPPRHRTLCATIEWSYDLLPPAEQALFRQMGVFIGGCELPAIQAVSGCGADVLPLLAGLVDASLLMPDVQDDPEPRFRMLETTREYALARLEASGAAEAMRDRHADYFVQLCADAEPALKGPDPAALLARLDAEHDNLRAALRHTIRQGRAEAALALGSALWKFWEIRGHAAEGLAWLEAALTLRGIGEVPAIVRARALNAAGNLALIRGDHARALAAHEAGLCLRRETGDTLGIARSLLNLGSLAIALEDPERALDRCGEALALFRQLRDERGTSMALNSLGMALTRQALHAEARAALLESLAVARRCGYHRGIAIALGNLGDVSLVERDHARAESLLRESLELFRVQQDRWGGAACLESLAFAASASSQHQRAAQLLGAAAAARSAVDAALTPAETVVHDQLVDRLEVVLGRRGLRECWDAGQRQPFDEAAAFALRDAPLPAQPVPCPLTERERDVARLVARGCTSKQIAEILVIAKLTADKHVGNILNKLGLSSRTQIAAWAVANIPISNTD